MKFSAAEAGRKWPCGGLGRDQMAMVMLAVLFMPAAAAGRINDTVAAASPRRGAGVRPRRDSIEQAGPKYACGARAPPAPSACRLALTDAVAIAPSIPPIKGPGACGGDDLVRLEAVVLPTDGRVPVKPAATFAVPWRRRSRTRFAPTWRRWRKGSAAGVSELDNFNSFECRGRNRVAGAKLSEHGRANALDVRAAQARQRPVDRSDRSGGGA